MQHDPSRTPGAATAALLSILVFAFWMSAGPALKADASTAGPTIIPASATTIAYIR